MLHSQCCFTHRIWADRESLSIAFQSGMGLPFSRGYTARKWSAGIMNSGSVAPGHAFWPLGCVASYIKWDKAYETCKFKSCIQILLQMNTMGSLYHWNKLKALGAVSGRWRGVRGKAREIAQDRWFHKGTMSNLMCERGKEDVCGCQTTWPDLFSSQLSENGNLGKHLLLEIWSQSFLNTLDLREGDNNVGCVAKIFLPPATYTHNIFGLIS